MAQNSFLKILFQILTLVSGCFILWNISFFRPYHYYYPPIITYSISEKNTGSQVVTAAPGKHYHHNGFKAFLLGKHYRFLWALPVKVPVLDLNKKSGGLKVTGRGGGMQTIKLNLKDRNGNDFALRSVDKDPISVVPGFARPTIATSFVRDQISATDPYATLIVAELSASAQIPFTRSKLVFVKPDDPQLNRYGVNSGGFFYLSPRIPDIKQFQKPQETFTGFFSTEEMLQKLSQDSGNTSVDTALFLKCRLFDLLIGDWDRHAGQWNWAGFSSQNHTIFRPVPKDRDQAMSYYQDGFLPFLLTRNFAVQKITSFTPEYEDIEGFAKNGSVLDNRFLKGLDWNKYVAQAHALQMQLTDKVLRAALNKYPPEVNDAIKEKRFKTFKIRRQHLVKAAKEYYQIIRERNAVE